MLECKSLTFAYPGCEPIFHNLSMSVAPGEKLLLAAPSGFGKTTLCRLLSNYLKPTSGEVLVDGKSFDRKGVCPVQLIGQHPELSLDPRMRMRDSLTEAGEADEHLIWHLGIQDEWMNRYPHELSGGELQRFCIARALTANPKYLIADEVSTMLDALTQARIWHVLLDEADKRNLGLVFTTHSDALAKKVATRVVDLTQYCNQ